MLVERVFPQVLGGKATLYRMLTAEGKSRCLSDREIEALISIIPLKLLNVDCFFDRLTDLWRYEFGRPYNSISQNWRLGTRNQIISPSGRRLPVRDQSISGRDF